MDSRFLAFLFFVLFAFTTNAQNNCSLSGPPSGIGQTVDITSNVVVAQGSSFGVRADDTTTLDTNSTDDSFDFLGCFEDGSTNKTIFYFRAVGAAGATTITYDGGATVQNVEITGGGENPSPTPAAFPTPSPTPSPPTPSPPTPSPPTPSPPTPSPPTPSPPTPSPPTPAPTPKIYPPTTKSNCPPPPPPPHGWGSYPSPPSYPIYPAPPSYPAPGVVGAATNNGGRVIMPGVVNGGTNLRPAASVPTTTTTTVAPTTIKANSKVTTPAPANGARVLIPPVVTIYPANGANAFTSAPANPLSPTTTLRGATPSPILVRASPTTTTSKPTTTTTTTTTTTSRPSPAPAARSSPAPAPIGVRAAPVATPVPTPAASRRLFPFP